MLEKMADFAPKELCYRINRGKIYKYSKWKCSDNLCAKVYRKILSVVMFKRAKKRGDEQEYIDVYEEGALNLKGNVLYDEFNHTSDKYIRLNSYNLKEVFRFPEFDEQANISVKARMLETESVALHIRRSDHMYDNAELFERGYFRKAVQYMREHIYSPVFYIFSEEIDWCQKNLENLGINEKEDAVYIIDWNKGNKSFRDMQLMTFCRHNILAISSFSWWGYYLSRFEDKVVCAPKGYWFEVPVHL